MKTRNSFFLFSTMLALSFFSACGGGGGENNTVLTIAPAGPTVVQKGDTLTFSASRTDVTWSVQGGDSNGTISTAGLYSPPTTLPTTSPKVLVEADSSDGQVATSEVDLRTGSALTFGIPVQINDNTISLGALDGGFIFGGLGDHLAVRLGSVSEEAIWQEDNSSKLNPLFSRELDFGGFSLPLNLIPSTIVSNVPSAIVEDGNENPGIFLIGPGTTNPRVFFMSSSNQGQSFNAAQEIFPDTVVPANFQQTQAFARFDDQGELHFVFAQQDQSLLNAPQDIFYSHSTDGGVTWSAPKQVSASATSESVEIPNVAVDSSGKIYVTWQSNGSGKTVEFSSSVDGGQNFSAPNPLTSSGHVSPPRLAVGPSGEIYISYVDGDGTPANSNVFFVKSTDGGQNFSSPGQVNSDPIHAFDSVFPMISVDSLGRLDVVWGADPDSTGDLDTLMYARSVDDGGTFSTNQPIASGPSGSNSTGTFTAPFGLRHDITGRFYVPYVIGTQGGGFNFNVLHGE